MNDRESIEPSLEPSDSGPAETTDTPAGDEGGAEVLPDGNIVGEDNIREGKVGGVMGGPHQQGGEGGGG